MLLEQKWSDGPPAVMSPHGHLSTAAERRQASYHTSNLAGLWVPFRIELSETFAVRSASANREDALEMQRP